MNEPYISTILGLNELTDDELDLLIEAGNLYRDVMSDLECRLVAEALSAARGNQVRASKILGINRNTLRKKIDLYNIGVAGNGH